MGSLNGGIVVLEEVVFKGKMSYNHRPQIIVKYVSIFISIYDTICKAQGSNTMKTDASPDSVSLVGAHIQVCQLHQPFSKYTPD